jgi:adenylate cyclase
MGGLSEQELAQHAGASAERIHHLIQLGVLAPSPNTDGFRTSDVRRVQLADDFERAGIALPDLGRAMTSGDLWSSVLDLLYPEPPVLSGRTYRELCDEIGISFELLERLYIGFGLPRPEPDDGIRADDAEILPLLPTILEAGMTEGQVLRGVRMYGEHLQRLAEGQVGLLHAYMEPLERDEVLAGDLLRSAAETSRRVRPVAERLVGWLYRRHREHYTTQHLLDHAEQAMEQAGLSPPRVDQHPAIAFLDLTGFTQVTEEQGDEAAADLAAILSELVAETADRHRGSAVKWLGDGVMFYFRDPANAISCGLELVQEVPAAGLPPARVGVAAGPVLYREGDYFGRTVNEAARIADCARPGEVLVSQSVYDRAGDAAGYTEIGPIHLRGFPRPCQLFVAVALRPEP